MKIITKNNKTGVIIALSAIITILTQLLVIPRLPGKYFYDSNNIIELVNGYSGNVWNDSSYMFAASFFKFINILGFSSFAEWSFVCTLVCFVILVVFFCRFNSYSVTELIVICTIVFFSNIYLFRISKDIIQWLFWFLILACFSTGDRKKRLVFLVVLFIAEAILFRAYYLGIIAICLIVYFFTTKAPSKFKKTIVACVVLMIIGLFILSKVDSSFYYKIIHIRQTTNSARINSSDASTIIQDIIQTDNTILYALNQIVNFVRILFPVELFAKNIIYIPFIIFQIYLFWSIARQLKKKEYRNDKKFMLLQSMTIAYFVVSAIFEPDFGSVIRHEMAAMPIIFTYIMYGKERL